MRWAGDRSGSEAKSRYMTNPRVATASPNSIHLVLGNVWDVPTGVAILISLVDTPPEITVGRLSRKLGQ